MKIKVWIYCLINEAGDRAYKTVNDPGDNICIGIHDKDGVYRQYDSYEAWHLDNFCVTHGFRYECVGVEIEVPKELT